MRLDLSRKRARCTPVSRCTALCVAANFDAGPVFQNSDQRHDVSLAEPLRRAEAPELANGLVHPHRHTERLGFLRAKRDVLHHRGQPGAEVQRAGQHRIWHLVQCRAIGPEETLITFTIRSGSNPPFAPSTNASNAVAMLAALIRLFTRFISCAWHGRSPTSDTSFPMRCSHGRISSRAARGPAAITHKASACAPPTGG